ncbi:hypothetical protein V6N13_035175 [Hibiscus sabdariffa]|uniref:Reverse transcriptase zinc-binding domain-containing protein n=2 Tax=Hibiscus sabdariffa TaxID=183260 RepID=A0ABR2A1Q9_9ROSI
MCSICGEGVEDIDHILRRCTKARTLWTQVFGDAHIGGDFFEQSFDVWLQNNLSSSASWGGSVLDWGMQFSVWCWLLWKLRCSMVFDVEFTERDRVLHTGLRLIAECERVFGLMEPIRVKEVSAPLSHGTVAWTAWRWFCDSTGWFMARLDEESARWLSERDVDDLESSRVRDSGIVFDPGASQ